MEEGSKTRHWAAAALAGLMALAAAWALWTAWSPEPAMGPQEPAVTALSVWSAAEGEVIPLGRAVGIKLFSDGVLVVGLSKIETQAGQAEPGRACGLKVGDLITTVNGQDVNSIEEVQALLRQERDAPLAMQVRRGERSLQLSAQAAQNRQGDYQLGVWLRDSMAGIGTMTFYDPSSGQFAALGHGVNDTDTALLMPLHEGSIMQASVADVKKGEKGSPGELHGQFDLNRDLGEVTANTSMGIYGNLADAALLEGADPVPVAAREEVRTGEAVIRSNVEGETVEEYTVNILQLYPEGQGETRNMMLEVTDPRLLERTGGIVQGMSGSPILQNGKLVGAVTHVLVNDPTRGYGILAEQMLAQMTQPPQAKAS